MTTIAQLSVALRPIAVSDLRSELGNMRSGEALMLMIGGREFIVIGGSDWTQIVEAAGDHDALPLVPDEL